MFDIGFYMKVNDLRKRLENGEIFEKNILFDKFEEARDKRPIIYNIETTNACNMRCKMCPRTTMMTRKIETMNKDTFIKIIDQIEPFTETEWKKWEDFVSREYGIPKESMSENHFFLYIIPKVIQLHGYGDPLLDKNMAEHVKTLSKRGFFSYFSCNPANIDIDKTVKMFQNGLNFIKYSIESIDDLEHKKIRGNASNFKESYKKICQLLEIKSKEGFNTTFIITMLNLNRANQEEEYCKLKKAFEDLDVYIYLKSEDQQWYRKDFHGTCSIHWKEFCKHPWMSMTIKSNGEVAMCMEDFNNEIILGNVKEQSLAQIWNGEKYNKFRKDHFNLRPGIKCTQECDMKLVGHFFRNK